MFQFRLLAETSTPWVFGRFSGRWRASDSPWSPVLCPNLATPRWDHNLEVAMSTPGCNQPGVRPQKHCTVTKAVMTTGSAFCKEWCTRKRAKDRILVGWNAGFPGPLLRISESHQKMHGESHCYCHRTWVAFFCWLWGIIILLAPTRGLRLAYAATVGAYAGTSCRKFAYAAYARVVLLRRCPRGYSPGSFFWHFCIQELSAKLRIRVGAGRRRWRRATRGSSSSVGL